MSRAAELHEAAEQGNAARVEELLEGSADVDATHGPAGRSPLFPAVRGGHVAVMRVLLEAGADVEFQDAAKVTALGTEALNLTPYRRSHGGAAPPAAPACSALGAPASPQHPLTPAVHPTHHGGGRRLR